MKTQKTIQAEITSTLRMQASSRGGNKISFTYMGIDYSAITDNTLATDAAFDPCYDDIQDDERYYTSRREAQESLVRIILAANGIEIEELELIANLQEITDSANKMLGEDVFTFDSENKEISNDDNRYEGNDINLCIDSGLYRISLTGHTGYYESVDEAVQGLVDLYDTEYTI